MKRWIGSLVLSGVAAVAMAQAPFTIVRPVDGARVREKVHILIPKGSIPPGGYVGVFLDDKLVEAVVPPLKGKFYEYILDTKGRQLPDTPEGQTQKLELVLYTDYNEVARIVDRSSVNVKIGNKANIPIPNEGIKLRYKFTPGQEMIYDMTQNISVSPMSEEQNEMGGKAATFDTEGEKIRLSYTVMNTYGNGDGLLRLQAIPTKGKDYADLTPAGATEQQRFYDTDMAPLYMRVNSTGREIFGALPAYVGFEGTVGTFETGGLFAAFPLPTLPEKAVHLGDSWQSGFQRGKLNLDNWVGASSVVKRSPARGEFVGVEWESGHPCARIRNVIEAVEKNSETAKLQEQGAQFSGDKVKIEENIWFALDTHQILKIKRDETIDQKIENSSSAFGGPAGGGPPSGMPPGMPGKGGGKGAPMGGDLNTPAIPKMQFGGPPGGGGPPQGFRPPMGPGGQRGGPGMGMPPGFGGGQNGGRGGNTQMQATYVRIHRVMTFTLEK